MNDDVVLMRATRAAEDGMTHVGTIVRHDDGFVAIYAVDPNEFIEAMRASSDVQVNVYDSYAHARASGWDF